MSALISWMVLLVLFGLVVYGLRGLIDRWTDE